MLETNLMANNEDDDTRDHLNSWAQSKAYQTLNQPQPY